MLKYIIEVVGVVFFLYVKRNMSYIGNRTVVVAYVLSKTPRWDGDKTNGFWTRSFA